ncbi:MAG: GyrI-like domain-containing protein [Alicyclobacillus sp.]|nr:GyrI-like domain-containing protein [Alicyclobacillus sp.]
MNIELVSQPKTFTLHGFSTVHDADKAYSTEMFELMDKLWAEVREKQLPHLGINHVVYDCGNIVFAGVELSGEPDTSLEKRQVTFQKYAYYKHIGPAAKLGDAYSGIEAKLKELGLTSTCPSMEIYGHWTVDESKFETEILISVK